MKHYVNTEGKYLGGWDDNPPIGAIEVPDAPDDARKLWDFPGWSNPAPSYAQALAQLNATYQSGVDALSRAFTLAYLSDGTSQDSKQASIRAQLATLKTQYSASMAALRSEYGV